MSIMRQYIDIFETKKRPSKVSVGATYHTRTADLAPVLSKDNVEYHYNVLSNGYVDRYNNGEGDPDFNYGGAMLHNIFWSTITSTQRHKSTHRCNQRINRRKNINHLQSF
jgi:superoxide dismutase